MSNWTTNDIPDLHGKTAIVTGANSGLGLETARSLAGAGATVILACRNTDKGATAASDIRGTHAHADVTVRQLDLADLASIREFAAQFAAAGPQLDILINNAGVMALPLRRTADGFEMQVGTNHLGHFALTGLLLERLLATPGARIVTVSSLAHKRGRINLDDLNWNTRRYWKWPAYCQAKLANLQFALELDRRLRAAGSGAISVAAHPGISATHLQLAGPEMTGSQLVGGAMKISNLLWQSSAAGALPSLYAGTAADVSGGDYFGPHGPAELRGKTPGHARIAGRAKKQAVAEKLWRLSEQLTAVDYAV